MPASYAMKPGKRKTNRPETSSIPSAASLRNNSAVNQKNVDYIVKVPEKTSPGWAAGNNNNGSQAGGAENSLLVAAPDKRQGVTCFEGAIEGGRVAGLWLAVE
jgi:hypothetical protein